MKEGQKEGGEERRRWKGEEGKGKQVVHNKG